jgi:hypothetical protein
MPRIHEYFIATRGKNKKSLHWIMGRCVGNRRQNNVVLKLVGFHFVPGTLVLCARPESEGFACRFPEDLAENRHLGRHPGESP